MLVSLFVLCVAASQVYGYPSVNQQSLETALIEIFNNEVANIQPKDPVICHSRNKKPDGVLTLGKLKQMFSTVRGGNAATYIYIPRARTPGKVTERVYESKGFDVEQHAESRMSKNELPSGFGLTNSPCNECAKNLMRWYDGKKKKPTILFAHFYITRITGKNDVDEYIALQCLARMLHEGFDLGIWDWDGFSSLKEIMDNPECIKAVEEAQKKGNFAKHEKKMEAVLDRARELSKDKDVGKWCDYKR